MGKLTIKIKCLRCGKEFWVKPKKNKKTGKVEANVYCQACRHKMAAAGRPIPKRRESKNPSIKVVSRAVDHKRDVEVLRQIEVYNPRALDKLRTKNEE